MVVIYSQDRKKGNNSLLGDNLLDLAKRDYPNLRFVMGKKYAFRPPRTIMVGPDESGAEMLLLHEISHALCEHRDYTTDLQRVKMESEAWEKAKELAKQYGIAYNEDMIESELDTYRDWLHKKSRCPKCGLTRFQSPDSLYHCPRCESLLANKK